MYKITVDGRLSHDEIANIGVEEVENLLRTKINASFVKSIDEKLNEFSFIDLSPDEKTGDFTWHADVVICSDAQVQTSIKMVVQNLINLCDLEPDEIRQVLEPLSTNMEGW